MASNIDSGTTTLSTTTETTLENTVTAGIHVCQADVSDMADGDTIILRVKKKVLTGGTEYVSQYVSVSNDRGNNAVVSFPADYYPFGLIFTAERTRGASCNVQWSVDQMDA